METWRLEKARCILTNYKFTVDAYMEERTAALSGRHLLSTKANV